MSAASSSAPTSSTSAPSSELSGSSIGCRDMVAATLGAITALKALPANCQSPTNCERPCAHAHYVGVYYQMLQHCSGAVGAAVCLPPVLPVRDGQHSGSRAATHLLCVKTVLGSLTRPLASRATSSSPSSRQHTSLPQPGASLVGAKLGGANPSARSPCRMPCEQPVCVMQKV